MRESSLRVAAGEIGVSFSGLRTFLAGTDPYAATLAKLSEWYVAQVLPAHDQVIDFALAVLVEALPEATSAAAEARLRAAVADAFRDAGVTWPAGGDEN